MKPTICPRCRKVSLIEIADGYYKCSNCGYVGPSTFDKDLFKRIDNE